MAEVETHAATTARTVLTGVRLTGSARTGLIVQAGQGIRDGLLPAVQAEVPPDGRAKPSSSLGMLIIIDYFVIGNVSRGFTIPGGASGNHVTTEPIYQH